jgi:prepilin-type processing-associated H-X9-DG protein
MYNDTIPPPTWWPQPAGYNADYRTWMFLLRDAGLVRNGKGVNYDRPEVIAFRPGTYPEGIWRCPSGEAAIPIPDWSENKTHYAMSGNLTHVNVVLLPRNKWYWKVSMLPDPGRKVLLADSWHYAGNNHAIYAGYPDVTSGNSALSFRHREAINLLFFDGHAETKSRGPDDPVLISSRFVLDFCKPPEWTW